MSKISKREKANRVSTIGTLYMPKMDIFTQKLYAGISWSSFEIIIFQTLLLTHNVLIFKKIPFDVYSKVGLIFSIGYGCSHAINGGFELFYIDTPTDSNGKNVLTLVQGIWIGLCITTLIIIRQFWKEIPFLAIILAAAESLKRTGKVVNFASLHFALIAQYELIHVTLYCATIWGLSYAGFNFNEYLLTVPVICTTLCCAVAYSRINTQYKQLYIPKNFWWLLKKRIMLCSSTFYHIIFSGNFLTPLIHILLGPLHASAIKLASNCTHGILAIAERIVGTSATLLCTESEFPKMYTSIGRYLWYYLGGGLSLTIVIISYSLWSRDMTFLIPYGLLYVIMHGAGLASSLCERILFAQAPQAPYILSSLTIISCFFLYTIGIYYQLPVLTIALFICMRIVISLAFGIKASRQLAPTYFSNMKHNLAVLFCILILCVFFMRE